MVGAREIYQSAKGGVAINKFPRKLPCCTSGPPEDPLDVVKVPPPVIRPREVVIGVPNAGLRSTRCGGCARTPATVHATGIPHRRSASEQVATNAGSRARSDLLPVI